MVNLSKIFNFTLTGRSLARHIARDNLKVLKQDARRLREHPSDKVSKIVQSAVKALGRELQSAQKDAIQARLITFVAELPEKSATHELHHLLKGGYIEKISVESAFYSALGHHNESTALNIAKAFPELLFSKMSDHSFVFQHLEERHWNELIAAGLFDAAFFNKISDSEAYHIIEAMPSSNQWAIDDKLLSLIKTRKALRSELLDYFDQLVQAKDSKASLILRLTSMPISSRNHQGEARILNYCKAFSKKTSLNAELLKQNVKADLHFFAELLSVVDIPMDLKSYEIQFLVGKLLVLEKNLKRRILDHINDPQEKKERNAILEHCQNLYLSKQKEMS